MSSGESPDGSSSRVGSKLGPLKEKLPPPEKAQVDRVEQDEEEEAEESADDAWDEDYDEHVDGEEPPPPKPKKAKKRRYKAIIIVSAIVIMLALWTVLTPEVMPEVGTTYVESDYANLGNYTGVRSIWAGSMTWGVAINGSSTATAGTPFDLKVLVTKVREKPGNWFLQGTSVKLKNVSFFNESGECVGVMSNWTDVGYGLLATVPVTLDAPGSFYLYVYVKFMVFSDMLIGFLPLESVQIPQAYLDVPIVVS